MIKDVDTNLLNVLLKYPKAFNLLQCNFTLVFI